MPQFDTIIKGGTIVDGTGAGSYVGDVAIRDGRIVGVGSVAGDAGEVIDATGLHVCPGWVDVHTHIDGQVTWDPTIDPLTNNGVTTAVMGNCGVGFAPCSAPRRRFLMELMEGVEDIPLGALDVGIQWNWESFPEFLDALGKKEMACDIAAMIGHGPVRAHVLGHKANFSDRPGGSHEHPVGAADIEKMAAVVEEAIAAGAVGFSTSRTLLHRDKRGVLVPGTCALEDELCAIGRAIRAGGGGLFELASDFMCYDDVAHTPENHVRRLQHFGREWMWMKKISKGYDVPVCFCLGIPSSTPKDQANSYRGMLRLLDDANSEGCNMRSQVFVRPQSVLMCWDSLSHPFAECATFLSHVRKNKKADRAALKDPQIRRALCEEATALASGAEGGHFGITLPKSSLASEEGEQDDETAGNLNCTAGERGALAKMFLNNTGKIFRWSASNDPKPGDSVQAAAAEKGVSAAEIIYDWMCEEDCQRVLQNMFMNFANGTVDDSLEMLQHEQTVPGLGDAGAHLGFLCDAASHTYLLTHYVRDAKRLSIEAAVKLHAKDCADLFGFSDRGSIEVGKRADINIIDLKRLQIHCPKFVRDLPTGAARWTQHTSGYTHTLCNGVVTFREGKGTGALPGRLVRNKTRKQPRPPCRYDGALGRAQMAASVAKWEALDVLIFKMLLPVLGATRFQTLGTLQDSKPLRPRGQSKPVLPIIALLIVVAYCCRVAGLF
eukprot:TRINITY_DN32642_c0_g1_i1.p1 TRINITY_DN32642_c0_g1~~TRINITY_DN32642_c0_g1_i1.p1  ORF type:complete len:746 (+),score=280.29 TRINITY_DN32642_c0_g1_i1:80-2239(+)